MANHRRAYSQSRARRTSRQVANSTIGTHVARRSTTSYRRHDRNDAVVRRARIRRIAFGVLVALVVIGIAIGAGFLAFRGVVGGEFSLKDSNAKDALVPVRSNEPSYTLVTVELGAVADPLETNGPDAIFLARLDSENHSMALVNVPSGLQVTSDNRSEDIASIATKGDAALIGALSTLAKIDISHIVKITSKDDTAALVDALGGIDIDVKQAIDDPHAGSVCIPEGQQTLDGSSALTFLRATNLANGSEDRLVNQLNFATQVLSKVFAKEGSFARRLESIGTLVQTDYSLADLEAVNSWLGGVSANDISTAILPGYYAVVTNVTGTDEGRYVSTASDVAELISKLEDNEKLTADSIGGAGLVSPSSFTVSIQNGTTIEGAASAMADLLKNEGFKVGDVGNAENPVFEGTIVVYRGGDENGLARAKTVIDAIGVGRPVDGDAYYSFNSDILLIIGADNKPMS